MRSTDRNPGNLDSDANGHWDDHHDPYWNTLYGHTNTKQHSDHATASEHSDTYGYDTTDFYPDATRSPHATPTDSDTLANYGCA